MKASTAPPAGPGLRAALRRRAEGRTLLTFAEFMEVALYDPESGYYRRRRPRVGYGPGTDFLTATASAPLFGRLVVAACARLLAPADPGGFEFVEIGAEPGAGLLRGLAHPFRSARQVGIGEGLRIQGPSVVFSNELFDAQPFRRFRFRGGQWRERGVALEGEMLAEEEIPEPAPPPFALPAFAAEGYQIDAPFAATRLARAIADQPWSGLFLALDYGKSWEEIAYSTPEGTARAYRNHAQERDLLAHPGEQDLTCHVCWDWLRQSLEAGGFPCPCLESQEAFFTLRAGDFIAALAAAEAGRMSRDKLSLLQLLHPANMGQQFQALWALRPSRSPSQTG
jgi:SAM-dependent MidA family methyltransferase